MYILQEKHGKRLPVKIVDSWPFASCTCVPETRFCLCYRQILIEFNVRYGDRQVRRRLSEEEMNRGIGMLEAGLSQRGLLVFLGCPRALSQECGLDSI